MTAHDHRTVVAGCYRCELSSDETREAVREDLIEEAAQETFKSIMGYRFKLKKADHLEKAVFYAAKTAIERERATPKALSERAEPSDAQVHAGCEAAIQVLMQTSEITEWVRAALRAAWEVRGDA